MKPLTKKELAEQMQISKGTLQYYLNTKWIKFIEPLGYCKTQRIITPCQLEKIFFLWGENPLKNNIKQ